MRTLLVLVLLLVPSFVYGLDYTVSYNSTTNTVTIEENGDGTDDVVYVYNEGSGPLAWNGQEWVDNLRLVVYWNSIPSAIYGPYPYNAQVVIDTKDGDDEIALGIDYDLYHPGCAITALGGDGDDIIDFSYVSDGGAGITLAAYGEAGSDILATENDDNVSNYSGGSGNDYFIYNSDGNYNHGMDGGSGYDVLYDARADNNGYTTFSIEQLLGDY